MILSVDILFQALRDTYTSHLSISEQVLSQLNKKFLGDLFLILEFVLANPVRQLILIHQEVSLSKISLEVFKNLFESEDLYKSL